MIIKRSCDGCGKRYSAKSKRSKYCSQACRTRASRAGASVVVPIRPAGEDGDTVLATRAALEELDRVESAIGAQALVLAARLDSGVRETGSSLAAVSRELRAVMAEARIGGKPASSIDMLRARRDAKRAGTG